MNSNLHTTILLLLLFVAPLVTLGAADESNQLAEWLPHCFDTPISSSSTGETTATNVARIRSCVQDNVQTECFKGGDGQSLLDVVTCVNDTLPEPTFPETVDGQGNYYELFVEATRNCLDPYVDCVNETIRDLVDSLPPCVSTSLRALATCAVDHRDDCRQACTRPTDMFFSDNDTQLYTCKGIQSNLMDPVCEIVDCCDPCVEPFEDLMNCIVNDVLDYTVNDCDLQCSGGDGTTSEQGVAASRGVDTGGRHRVLHDDAHDDDDDEDSIAKACLEYAPGLTGTTVEELGARAKIFLPCVYLEYLDIFASTSAGAGRALVTVAVAMAASVAAIIL